MSLNLASNARVAMANQGCKMEYANTHHECSDVNRTLTLVVCKVLRISPDDLVAESLMDTLPSYSLTAGNQNI